MAGLLIIDTSDGVTSTVRAEDIVRLTESSNSDGTNRYVQVELEMGQVIVADPCVAYAEALAGWADALVNAEFVLVWLGQGRQRAAFKRVLADAHTFVEVRQ